MSTEQSTMPCWRPIAEADKYACAYLLYGESLINPDFNPSGVVEGHWCDDLGWQAAVWNGYTDQFDTLVIEPTHFMPKPEWQVAPPAPVGLDACASDVEQLQAEVRRLTKELSDRTVSLSLEYSKQDFLQSEINKAVDLLANNCREIIQDECHRTNYDNLKAVSTLGKLDQFVRLHDK